MRLASFRVSGHEGFGTVTDDGIIELTGRLSGRQKTLRDALEANVLKRRRRYPWMRMSTTVMVSSGACRSRSGEDLLRRTELCCDIAEMGYELPEYPSIRKVSAHLRPITAAW